MNKILATLFALLLLYTPGTPVAHGQQCEFEQGVALCANHFGLTRGECLDNPLGFPDMPCSRCVADMVDLSQAPNSANCALPAWVYEPTDDDQNPSSGNDGNPSSDDDGNPSSDDDQNSSTDVDVRLGNPFSRVGDNLFDLLEAIFNNILLPIAGVLAVLAFIYSGFLYVKAQGNETKIAEAHRAFLYTAVGTAILLGSWVIANVIKNTVDQLL